jgi:predicted Zn-dependent peptidase
MVVVGAGSRYEEKRVNGMSHFLEHMFFKGSRKYPTAEQISTIVDSIGAINNAATDKEVTFYYMKSSANYLELASDIISSMLKEPIFAEEEIEREKGVITEEIRMYEDTPLYRIGDVFEQLALSPSPLGRDIIGSERTVNALKRNDFLRYRDTHYYADNFLITVAGGVKEKEVISLAKKYFESVPTTREEVEEPKISILQKKPRVKLHSKKKEQAHFIFGYLAEGRGYKGRFAQAVLSAILGGGMSSRLFTQVREKRGLAYSIRTSIDRYQGVGYLGTYAGVDVKRVGEAVKVVLDEHQKLVGGKVSITKGELKKAKEYLKGHLALALEDTKDVNSFFAENQLFLDKIETPEEVFANIDKVSSEDVLAEARRLFRPEKLNLAIIGPYDNQERFEKLLE